MNDTSIDTPRVTARAVLADDEPYLLRVLKDRLYELWPELEIVACAENGLEAAESIARLAPDVAFLDIQMPGLTGLEVAQGIEGCTRVVFVTAYDEHALEAFEHEAVDYVLKPVREERLARTVQRLHKALAAAEPGAALADEAGLARLLQRLLPAQAPGAQGLPAAPRLRHLRASQGMVTHQIAVDDVIYLQADEKYTVVRTAEREFLIRTSISELMSQLDPDRFWQVHRGTLVNIDQLLSTRRDDNAKLYLRMKGVEGELPVSRAYVHLFKAM